MPKKDQGRGSATGALVATSAMCGRTCACRRSTSAMAGVQDAHWRGAIQAGLRPISISIGFVAASAFVVTSVAVHNPTALLVIAVTAVMACTTRLNPLWILPQPRRWVRPDGSDLNSSHCFPPPTGMCYWKNLPRGQKFPGIVRVRGE